MTGAADIFRRARETSDESLERSRERIERDFVGRTQEYMRDRLREFLSDLEDRFDFSFSYPGGGSDDEPTTLDEGDDTPNTPDEGGDGGGDEPPDGPGNPPEDDEAEPRDVLLPYGSLYTNPQNDDDRFVASLTFRFNKNRRFINEMMKRTHPRYVKNIESVLFSEQYKDEFDEFPGARQVTARKDWKVLDRGNLIDLVEAAAEQKAQRNGYRSMRKWAEAQGGGDAFAFHKQQYMEIWEEVVKKAQGILNAEHAIDTGDDFEDLLRTQEIHVDNRHARNIVPNQGKTIEHGEVQARRTSGEDSGGSGTFMDKLRSAWRHIADNPWSLISYGAAFKEFTDNIPVISKAWEKIKKRKERARRRSRRRQDFIKPRTNRRRRSSPQNNRESA